MNDVDDGAAVKPKIMTILGTRPELIKMSRVVAELERFTDHCLVHSGQNYDYELNQVFFDELEIRKPDHFLEAVGDTVAESIGMIIARADAVLAAERPDAVVLYGDTNTCLSVIAAKRRHVPVFHLEAGNRCFDDRVPEEVNRRLVDHLSDVNMPLTEHARRYLLAEGIRADTVFTIGSPMREVLNHYSEGIAASRVLSRLEISAGDYLLVSAHREENVDDPAKLAQLVETLHGLAAAYDCPVILSTHPRTRARLQSAGAPAPGDQRVRYLPPFGYFDYVKLQTHARCVVSDSGTLTEEAAILGFPAVMIRDAHERPEGVDAGVLLMSALQRDRVLHAVDVVVRQHGTSEDVFHDVPNYQPTQVSRTVVRILLGYIGYVRRTVWSATD